MQRSSMPPLQPPPLAPRARGLIQYGRRFAQTAELYQAHGMEHQLEELISAEKKGAPKRRKGAKASSKAKRASKMSKAAPRKRGSGRKRG